MAHFNCALFSGVSFASTTIGIVVKYTGMQSFLFPNTVNLADGEAAGRFGGQKGCMCKD